MRTKVLGLPVDILSRRESFELMVGWLKEHKVKPRMVVTAYSEFFVKAKRDVEFAKIIKEADLVTPDGKSVLAAVEYQEKTQKLKNSKTQKLKNSKIQKLKNPALPRGRSKTQNTVLNNLVEGLKVGGKILADKVGETVTGVWLFEKITAEAEKRNWRIFLLGGWNNVSGEAAQILLKRFPGIKVAYDEGETEVGTDPETDRRVVEKIKRFNPDFLFVQYRPVVQEKWIASHLQELGVRVAIGIGGTLDEYVGRLKGSPVWMEKMGLKWLWRLLIQPGRWRRIIDAVIVFPWLVFQESIKKRPR